MSSSIRSISLEGAPRAFVERLGDLHSYCPPQSVARDLDEVLHVLDDEQRRPSRGFGFDFPSGTKWRLQRGQHTSFAGSSTGAPATLARGGREVTRGGVSSIAVPHD
jgi:hypothetical protein